MKTLINTRVIKFYDIFFSSIILFFLSPLLFLILIICFFESGNPIFIQKRVGKNQKPFHLIKFRTMKVNTPSMASHLINKRSITRFGRVIRLLKFDELPQLINVIKGDMSLVGPRPDAPVQAYDYEKSFWEKRVSVMPGITGFAQLYKCPKLSDRNYYESIYIKKRSFFFDLIIIFRTIFKLFYLRSI